MSNKLSRRAIVAGVTGALFVAAIGLVVAVVAWRVISKWHGRRALARMPGRSLDNPLSVGRFDEMDTLVQKSRCTCGGRLHTLSEGSRDNARVIHTECRKCEATWDFFFDTSDITH